VKKRTKKPVKKVKASSAKKKSKNNLRNKIKGLALQTQKTVQDSIYSQTEALKSKLNAYGIGVDDVKATAKHLEQVLKDLRNSDFLKQPGVQILVERVNRRNVEKSNVEAQRMAQKFPRKKNLSKKQKAKLDRQFNVISERAGQQLGNTVVQAIMKRVEEVRQSFSRKSPASAEASRRKVK